jgi:hypothetical protein
MSLLVSRHPDRRAAGDGDTTDFERLGMPVGPVELLVLSFPTEYADPGVIAAMQEVVAGGFITVLDLVFLSRSAGGEIREVDVTESLDDVGLGILEIGDQALISEDDLDLARDTLDPGHSAAVIVYENSWARTVSGAIADAGGELTLHVRIPRDVVEAALEAAEMD